MASPWKHVRNNSVQELSKFLLSCAWGSRDRRICRNSVGGSLTERPTWRRLWLYQRAKWTQLSPQGRTQESKYLDSTSPSPLYPLPSLPLVEPNFIQSERKPQESSRDRAWWRRAAGRCVGQSVSRFTTAKLAALGCLLASRLHWLESCSTQSFLHHGLTMRLRYSVPCTPHRCEFNALELRTGLS